MARTLGLGEVHGAGHGLDVAGYNHLARRVVIGSRAHLALGCLGSDGRHRFEIEAQQRRHSTHARRHRGLHRRAAQPQQTSGIGQAQAAGGAQGGIFAKAVPGHKRCLVGQPHPGFIFQHAKAGNAHRHDRRLGIGGEGQFLFRPFPHQPRQAFAQCFVNFFEHGTGVGAGMGKALAHAHRLAALARKDESANGPSPDGSRCAPPIRRFIAPMQPPGPNGCDTEVNRGVLPGCMAQNFRYELLLALREGPRGDSQRPFIGPQPRQDLPGSRIGGHAGCQF